MPGRYAVPNVNATLTIRLSRGLAGRAYTALMLAKSVLALIAPIALSAAAPAMAQVRVIVDGQAQDVPDGMVRTISYRTGGPRVIRDEPYRGHAQPGTATVTTTETIDEDEHGRMVGRSVVTRIEPVAASAYPTAAIAFATPARIPAPPPAFAPLAAAPAPQPVLDTVAYQPQGRDDVPHEVHIRRDPATGHFITAIRVNGVLIRAIVDTGAQSTILSARDAEATGVARDIVSTRPMIGIGGYTMLNVGRIRSLEVAGQPLGGFSAAIGQPDLSYTLLGQTEIARLGRIVIEDGVMSISPRAERLALR